MPLIYEPKGRAREYSPLALNVYSGGCSHGCRYCYCQNIFPDWNSTPNIRDISKLGKEAVRASSQILLSFVSDPYCLAENPQTRKALEVLADNNCPVAILTKGGKRCLQDLDLFLSWPSARIKVGATLTFIDPAQSLEYEPGAASPEDRLETLKTLHDNGVKTWASLEPVIDPAQSLELINQSLNFIDGYKVGKLSHRKTETNWKLFGMEAVSILRAAGKPFYVKHDLRAFLPINYLMAAESDQDALNIL